MMMYFIRKVAAIGMAAVMAACTLFPIKAEEPIERTVNSSWDFETQEDFDEWDLIDNDGDGLNWQWVHDSEDAEWWLSAYSGEGAAYSVSFVYNDSGYGGHQIDPDNLMISPEITGATYVSFWMRADDIYEYYDDDPVGVYVIDENGNSEMMDCYTTWYEWEHHIVDISEYRNQNIRIALRHFNTTDMGFAVILDLVETDGIRTDASVYEPGDVDMNGLINASDAMLALRYAMGLTSLSQQQVVLADIDESGYVDFTDGMLIMRLAMGL